MQFVDKLVRPGEHAFTVQGLAGTLDAVLTIPIHIDSNHVAILGHPHSLQGGTMNNKVVTTMARAFKELGIPSLRFNFRGVGQSEGIYDEGLGESEDMIALSRGWQKEQPDVVFIFAGFSFGSYVAYRAAAQIQPSMLITIAPSVHHYNYQEFTKAPQSWLIIQGNEDEVVSATSVYQFAEQSRPVIPVIKCADTTHFFHGKLMDLKAQLIAYVQSQVHLS